MKLKDERGHIIFINKLDEWLYHNVPFYHFKREELIEGTIDFIKKVNKET